MNYNEEKIDEYTLALLYLVTHERHEGLGARAWKGFDWDTLNRLHEKGYITNPIGKAKSVGMTEESFRKAEELFKKHFVKEAKTIPFPILTSPAKKCWSQIPDEKRKEIISNVWCSRCHKVITLQLRDGKMEGCSLVPVAPV
jgi:hypothetical protein